MPIDLSGVKMIDRPRMYRNILAAVTEELYGKLWVVGKNAKNGGGWNPPATRSRMRRLARMLARDEMRKVRAA